MIVAVATVAAVVVVVVVVVVAAAAVVVVWYDSTRAIVMYVFPCSHLAVFSVEVYYGSTLGSICMGEIKVNDGTPSHTHAVGAVRLKFKSVIYIILKCVCFSPSPSRWR